MVAVTDCGAHVIRFKMDNQFGQYGHQRQQAMVAMSAQWKQGSHKPQENFTAMLLEVSKKEHAAVDSSMISDASLSRSSDLPSSRRGGSKRSRSGTEVSQEDAASEGVDPLQFCRYLLALADISVDASESSILKLPTQSSTDPSVPTDDGKLPVFASNTAAADALVSSIETQYAAAGAVVREGALASPAAARWMPSPAAAHILLDIALSTNVARGKASG